MEFKLSFPKSGRFLKAMSDSPVLVRKGADIALRRIGDDIRNKAVRLAPHKTGDLRRSLSVQQSPLRVEIGTNLVYARIHDQGGRISAHTISPRRARALAFMMGGRMVFAKSVNIPARTVKPYKGIGYLTPAFKKYTNAGYLEDTIFHEVIRQFVE